MKLYKLTTKDDKTRPGKTNETQWGENVTREAKGEGSFLCSSQVIHAYTDPFLAVFMDPIHGKYGAKAHLWECEGEPVADDGTKVGCKCLTTVRRIPLPKLTVEQRQEIAIRCALAVYTDPDFIQWANAWLSGEDRSAQAAQAVSDIASVEYSVSYVLFAASAAAQAARAAAAATFAADAGADIVKIIHEVIK